MAIESHPVTCRGCHRTVLVAVSDLHPPCFRHFEEQAECPEIQARKRSNGSMLLLMMCDALKQSLAEKFEHAEVEPIIHGGSWRVACRIADDSSQFYSPQQARRQAELWNSYGQAKLADKLQKAADQAERNQFGNEARIRRSPRARAFIGLSAIVIAAVGAGVWYSLTHEETPLVVAAVPSQPEPPVAPASVSENLPAQAAFAAPVQPPPVLQPKEPEMVLLPGGTFIMGSRRDPSEEPVHKVTIKAFEISKFPITIREWNECVAAKVCDYVPTGDDDAPVTNVSWRDAQRFISWLVQITQRSYRLPSEAEWEYAARAGTQTDYWWGDQIQAGMADCKGCGEVYDSTRPVKVGSFRANPFGLYDMGGEVDQWVEDCWHSSYQGAPVDSSPWLEEACPSRVIRSGSWKNDPSYVRSASRDHYDTGVRYPTHGFRVARSP
jgi:formylglycine-generating enzyme required for sulfatase activity